MARYITAVMQEWSNPRNYDFRVFVFYRRISPYVLLHKTSENPSRAGAWNLSKTVFIFWTHFLRVLSLNEYPMNTLKGENWPLERLRRTSVLPVLYKSCIKFPSSHFRDVLHVDWVILAWLRPHMVCEIAEITGQPNNQRSYCTTRNIRAMMRATGKTGASFGRNDAALLNLGPIMRFL